VRVMDRGEGCHCERFMCATLYPLLFPPPLRGRVRVGGITGVPRNEGKPSHPFIRPMRCHSYDS